MAYNLALNYIWQTQYYQLECSMRGQYRGYFRCWCGSSHVITKHDLSMLTWTYHNVDKFD